MLTFGEPTFQLPLVLPGVIQQGLQAGISGFAVGAMRDELVTLACDLYTDSFFERSFETRFITLIGVLEVLKDQDSVSSEAVRLINSWLSDANHLESTEADSLCGQLRYMKQLSIRRGISRVVDRHLGPDRAREVQDLYDVRSRLVHSGERPADLQDRLRQVQLIVRNILIRILLSGSR